MRVILIRHGDAVSASASLGDAGRHLSLAGRQQATAAGRAVAERGIVASLVWCSPLVRAVQTAELVVAELSFAGVVEARGDLYSESPVESLVGGLSALGEGKIVVVGHQPFMGEVASVLLRCSVGGFGTGAAWCLLVDGGRAVLEWRWTGGRFVE